MPRDVRVYLYPSVSDVLVWGVADCDVPVLRRECLALLEEFAD
jgi:uncharacterized protein with HEPN domain